MKRLIVCLVGFSALWAQIPNAVIPLPHVAKFVAPAYPWKAREIRMQGETTAELKVRADGTVESADITNAHPFFRTPVQSALNQWRFEPTGQPFVQKVTVRFRLDDCAHIQIDAYKETRVQADLPQLVEIATCPDIIVTTNN